MAADAIGNCVRSSFLTGGTAEETETDETLHTYLLTFCVVSVCFGIIAGMYLICRLYLQCQELRREEAVWELLEQVAVLIADEIEGEQRFLRGEEIENQLDILIFQNPIGAGALIRRLMSMQIIIKIRGPGR